MSDDVSRDIAKLREALNDAKIPDQPMTFFLPLPTYEALLGRKVTKEEYEALEWLEGFDLIVVSKP